MKKDDVLKRLFLLEDAIISGDFSEIWQENPEIKECWKVTLCLKKSCPAFGRKNIRCWQVAGTFCRANEAGSDSIHKKWRDCRNCEVFLAATTSPERRLQEVFNNIAYTLSCFDQASSKFAKVKKNSEKIIEKFKLTVREKEIFSLLLDRWSRQDIAEKLYISPDTVKMHVGNIYKKLGVKSRSGLLKLINPS